jgi:glycosyltransferase involved in cell wall biosynthesis
MDEARLASREIREPARGWRILARRAEPARVKILYVDLETEWRGGQSQALEALTGLRRRGHDARLLAVAGGALAQRARDAGVPVTEVSEGRKRWRAASALRRILRDAPPDVVHANESHALTAAWLARAHRRTTLVAGRRLAYSIQRNPISRARYLAAHRIFAISDFVAQSVIASGIPPDRVVIVREGIEIPAPVTAEQRHAARRKWNLSEGDIALGCVGVLMPEKGQEFLICALPAICEAAPRARLLLAGAGPLREHLAELAEKLGVRDRVAFAGFVDHIEDVYAALDIFVFPSLAEPSGTSLLAAMAWGLPVIAVARGGVPEYVVDGANGVLIPAPAPPTIAAAAKRLIADSGLRDRLGARARSDMAERYATDVMVKNLVRACEQAAQARAAAESR